MFGFGQPAKNQQKSKQKKINGPLEGAREKISHFNACISHFRWVLLFKTICFTARFLKNLYL